MTASGMTTDRPPRRTFSLVTHTASTRVEELIRSWAPELRRGFIKVLVARDPPPRLRSRRANTLVALATWTGAALLLVALIIVLRSHGPGAVFVTPNGSGFNVTGTKKAGIAAVLGLLFLCVRSPLLAWRIGYALLLLLPLVSIDNAIRPPLAIAILVCYWVAGLRHGRAAAWAMCLLNLLPVWVLMRGQERPLLTTLALFVIQIALDATIASRRAGHALAEQVAQSELGEARRTVLEERTRIAREMHDVVAHHMSLIAVQAETAPYRLDDLSEGTKKEFAALSATAREALNDVRRLLGVLRSEGPAERAPQPQLADVATLIETSRRAGLSVELSMPANGAAAVSHAVGLCAYRIVQEALSNAGRHAPGAWVHVALERDPDVLRLDVVNGPPTTTADAEVEGTRTGHGIAGMKERVALVGGSLSAGPNIIGGFAVSAVLPLTEASP
jgi:signal transduction histidine kinase